MRIATLNAAVPKAINRIIEDRGLKRCAVAERAGMSAQAFSDIMNGRRLIKVCDLIAVASALGVTPNDLFGIDTTDQPV